MMDEKSCIRASEASHNASSTVTDDKDIIRARTAAYRYLSLRPRSRAELEQKLVEKEFSGAVIHSVLADLDRLGYVNDLEFAREWARSRIRVSGFGMRRIEQELKAKNISRDIIRETLAELFAGSSEADIARREAERKLKTLACYDPGVRRRRLAGFLERKGFSQSIIREIINEGNASDR